jgi:peptide/nickel transport system substrate-binding protein
MLACTPAEDTAERSAATGADPSTITIFFPGWDERSIIPAWNLAPSFQLFPPLLTVDARGEPAGVLVRSWDVSTDGRTWTYHLRTDLRWHDGQPFTSHDVAFTYELLSHPDYLRVAPGEYAVSVHDDSTVTISYANPQRRWLANYWTRFLPRHLLGHLDPGELVGGWEQFWPPVGYGPFQYAHHVPTTMVELEANPNWIGGRPAIDRVIIRFGGNPSVEFEAGNIDVAEGLNARDGLRLAERPGIDYCIGPQWFSSAIYWNHQHPAFSDVRVRRALTQAIDRQELAAVRGFPPDLALPDVLLTSGQRPAFRLDTRSEDWAWPQEVPQPIPHDPEAAASLLAEAGWLDTDGDGVREKANLELRFDLLTNGNGETEAVVLQEQFRRVGARVEIRILDTSAGRRRFEAGEFDAALGGVGGGSVAPAATPTPLFKALTGDPPGSPERPVGYFNPRLDSLAAVDAGFDEDLQEEIARELQSILRDDAVLTLLLPELRVTVFRSRIRGLTARCLNWHVDEWWVEEE